MVSLLAFYSNVLSSNPGDVYNFCVKLWSKRTKINKKVLGLGKQKVAIGAFKKTIKTFHGIFDCIGQLSMLALPCTGPLRSLTTR